MADYKTSRKVGKAATLPTAPAYTFGSRRDRTPADPGPGPGEYGPGLDISRRGIGFGSSTRYDNPGEPTPSALDYKPSTRHLKSAPGYSFGGKPSQDHLKSKTPGPGAYEPNKAEEVVKPGAPAYSIQARWQPSRESERRPAPNAYDPQGFAPKESKAASLKFRHEGVPNKDPGPGPGEYPAVQDVRPHTTGKTFGVSRSVQGLDNGVPGANYLGTPSTEPVKQATTAWTFTKSPRQPGLDNGVPGPGMYSQPPVIPHDAGHGIKSDNRSAPAYTMPSKYLATREPATPAPGEYGLPRDPRLKSAPAYSLHGTRPKVDGAKLPGPGAYDHPRSDKLVRTSAPAFSLSLKNEPPGSKDQKPSPQEYTLKLDSKPGVSMKFRHSLQNPQTTPGPLDYADYNFVKCYLGGSCCCKSKGYSFGLKPKPKARDPVPGPIYQVGCTTLGIAAATPINKSEVSRIAVL